MAAILQPALLNKMYTMYAQITNIGTTRSEVFVKSRFT